MGIEIRGTPEPAQDRVVTPAALALLWDNRSTRHFTVNDYHVEGRLL
jgi:hypothetical protein